MQIQAVHAIYLVDFQSFGLVVMYISIWGFACADVDVEFGVGESNFFFVWTTVWETIIGCLVYPLVWHA